MSTCKEPGAAKPGPLADAIRAVFATTATAADLEQVLAACARMESGQPYPSTDLAALTALFNDIDPPAAGQDFHQLLAEVGEKVLAHTPVLSHPMYLGHMTQALPWFSPLIEALTARINQNQVKVETAFASTLVERQTIGWLHRLVYRNSAPFYQEHLAPHALPLGNMVSGGTMGNLTALAAALETALPGAREDGLVHALHMHGFKGAAVVGSTRMHYSLKKAMSTLGLGAKALHLIPVDRNNQISLEAARVRVAELQAADIKIVAVVGVAGATETGSVDPLAALADLAADAGCWFHVDAAWGGALLLSDAHREVLAGIERADSVVLDGHKLFFVPMAQGALVVRNPAALSALHHNANYILRAQSGDLGQTSLEGSRRFDALKLWATIKLLGTDMYEAMFHQAGALAQAMCGLIEGHPDFELITSSDTFILTYRYVPAPTRRQLVAALAIGDAQALAILQAQLNDLNARLQEALKHTGAAFTSRTVLESTRYPGPTVVLRLVLTNMLATPAHLASLLEMQATLGATLGATLAPAS